MFKKIAAAAVLVAASSAALAAGPQPFYAGIAATSTKIEGFDREGGYGAFFGYKFNQAIAIEGGYYRVANDLASSDITVDQMDLSVIGTLPLSNGFDVYGRLGHNRAEFDSNASGYNATQSGAVYGVGLGYSFSPIVHGRLEVQKPASDTTKLVAGVAFRF
jgi:opacity protein-like surface antigen